jgi:hypothetical protein
MMGQKLSRWWVYIHSFDVGSRLFGNDIERWTRVAERVLGNKNRSRDG